MSIDTMNAVWGQWEHEYRWKVVVFHPASGLQPCCLFDPTV